MTGNILKNEIIVLVHVYGNMRYVCRRGSLSAALVFCTGLLRVKNPEGVTA